MTGFTRSAAGGDRRLLLAGHARGGPALPGLSIRRRRRLVPGRFTAGRRSAEMVRLSPLRREQAKDVKRMDGSFGSSQSGKRNKENFVGSIQMPRNNTPASSTT